MPRAMTSGIDSSLLGIDGTVELLKDLIRIKGIK